MSELEPRLREVELNHAKLAESFVDLKQRVETHKEYCGLPDYKNTVQDQFDSIKNRFNFVLGILVTILMVYFSGLSYLHLNKVNQTSFDSAIAELKRSEIRRDERMQVLAEQQQILQIKLLEEIGSLKVEITKLSRSLGN